MPSKKRALLAYCVDTCIVYSSVDDRAKCSNKKCPLVWGFLKLLDNGKEEKRRTDRLPKV